MMLFRRTTRTTGFGIVAIGLAAAAFVLGSAASSRAQSPTLAEVAKKEKERRKAVPAPKKVYTNKDLPESAVQPAASSTTTPAAPAAGQAQSTPEQKPAGSEKNEAWWRNRITTARDELRRNEVFLEALQSRVNALSADFVNRDDPYQRAKIGEERQKTLAQMDQVRKEIEEDKKLIEEIEEEARKAGVPPGWLR